jgi:Conserved hypothetical protein 698
MRLLRRSRARTSRREERVLNKATLPDIGFESYDSMEGLIAIDRGSPPARFASWPGAKLIHAVYPGVLVAGTIALASTWLAQHYTAPVMLFARNGKGESARATLPMFLVGFAVLVVANSIGLLPKIAIDLANDVSRWCLVAAIAALGMKTSFKALFAVGWRPIGLMVAETVWIAALVLLSVKMII